MQSKPKVSPPLGLALAVVYGVVIPCLVWALLRSSVFFPLFLIIVGGLTILHLAGTFTAGLTQVVLRVVAAVASAAMAAALLVGIIITPFSSYQLWFEAMRDGAATGPVSNLFTLLVGFFLSTLCGTFMTMGLLWPVLIAGLLASAVGALVMQSTAAYAIMAAAGFAVVLFLLLRESPGRFLARRVGHSVVVFGVALVAGLLLTGEGKPGGNLLVDGSLHPQVRGFVSNTLPQFPLLYGIPGYGYSFQERTLGGSPVLSPLPIFEVTSNVTTPLYLKTDVYDNYDGQRWTTSQRPQRFAGVPLDMARGRPSRREESVVRIELLIDYYNKLPFTLDTAAVYFEQDLPTFESAGMDRGFQLDTPITSGNVVHLVRRPEVRLEGLPSRSAYLQVPRTMPDEVQELSQQLGAGAGSPEQVLGRIERFLADNYTYTLSTKSLKRTEDLLEKFLFEDRRGYCVHFASTFVMLARMNGIPARYATGFLVYFPFGSDTAQVTGLSAHAWPEVWLPGRGWTTWEATPAVNPLLYMDFLDEEFMMEEMMDGFDFELDPATLRQMQAILGDRTFVSTDDLTLVANNPGSGLPLWPLAGVPLLLAAAYAGVVLVRRRVRHGHLSPQRRALAKVLRRYVTLGRTLGVPHPRQDGWQSWGETVGQRAPAAQRLIGRFLAVVGGAVYGQTNGSFDRDLRFLRRGYRRFLRYRLRRRGSLRTAHKSS